jgi:polyisoprenoid-binding protein YceI
MAGSARRTSEVAVGKLKLLVAALVGLAVLVVGGTWVYINVIREDAPERLTLQDDPTTSASAAASPAGSASAPAGSAAPAASGPTRWTATDGSIVGYRVDEILNGQNVTAVGRTSDVTGEVALEGAKVTEATFTADLTTVKSDSSRRDGQFQGRIMDTATHPTATFKLTQPIDLGTPPADGKVVSAKATGDLTLRGTTKSVVIDLQAKRTGDAAEISGSIPIVFEEFDIPNPSFGPARTEDNGELEVLLKLAPAS